jgi:hypothetical protein
VDSGSILGVSALRPSFLDHLSATHAGEAEAGHGTGRVGVWRTMHILTLRYKFEDDVDDDPDEDDDFNEDDEGDDEGEDEDDEEEETWQVSEMTPFR